MTRVTILVPSLDSRRGGVERFGLLLEESLKTSGLYVQRVAASTSTSKWTRRLGLGPLLAARRARAQITLTKPDVVVTNGTLGWIGSGPWRRLHVYHGTMAAHALADREGRRFRDWAYQTLLMGGLAEVLSGLRAYRVAVSDSAAREVRRYYGLRVHQVIENSVPIPEGVHENPPKEGFLYVGRRESRKGYELAVEVASGLGEQLRVAGPGTDPRTCDLGVLDYQALSQEYRRAAALIFPTKYEACSYVVLEALSHGCPVVTGRVGWIRTLLGSLPEYGALTPAHRDYASYTAAVEVATRGEGKELAGQASILVARSNNLTVFTERWTEAVVGLLRPNI